MTVRHYTPLEQARHAPGLRLVLSAGLPGPWGMAAKAFFDLKGVDYLAVAQRAGEANDDLVAWTGHGNAPMALLDDERVRTHWSEILMLAERLAPTPPLIPTEQQDRAAMFGLCHELCGEDGFGWSARTIMFAAADAAGSGDGIALLKARYGDDRSPDHGHRRFNAIVTGLAARLEGQRASGSAYLVGRQLSAADIYWAMFSTLIAPMAAEMCPTPPNYRDLAALFNSVLDRPVPEILIAHRDGILRERFDLPLWF